MSNRKVILMIQARMGSSRLPGKVLLEVKGKPILLYQISRLASAVECHELVVITSTLRQDDVLYEFCERNEVACFRGDAQDLLSRHYEAAKKFDAEVVVKIPSDCPLSDPALVDFVVATHLKQKADYTSNYHPASFADGFDVEVFEFAALERAYFEASKDWEREHTTPYIWERPHVFDLVNIVNQLGNHFLTHRLTLDYPEDFEMLDKLICNMPGCMTASYAEIIKYLDTHPEFKSINSKYLGVNWYRHVGAELETVDSTQWRNPDA